MQQPTQNCCPSVADIANSRFLRFAPLQYVEQSELEKFDGVSAGKYTIGLGQTKMSFCDDREGELDSLRVTDPSTPFGFFMRVCM